MSVVGTLFAMPLTLQLVCEHVELPAAVMMLVVGSTLVGVCTAYAYSRGLAEN